VSRHSPRGPLCARWAGSSAEGPTFDKADTATLRVAVDGEAYAARLFLIAASVAPTEVAWSRGRLEGLGETPLDVPVILCACLASAAEVASLDVGDAWMLGLPAGGRARSVLLAAPEAESGARADLVETGALVLRPGSAEVGGRDMSEPRENEPIVEAVGDVPVLVRVEVGTAHMAAREWAALAPGDVVALARGVGDPVTLRVGGVEVAKGELVDIEGEMGVRILRRMGGERAP
jgi:type III secretion system YscQ/HrcQ family protein